MSQDVPCDAIAENSSVFEQRKKQHIDLSLKKEHQTTGRSGLDSIHLPHCALPEIDFPQVTLKTEILGSLRENPLLISSMTAGHHGSINLNERLARVAAQRGWLMGVGSQRKELFDEQAKAEWSNLRRKVGSQLNLIGNIGLTQLIKTPISKIQQLVDSLEAIALFVHTNPLQESLQVEGTPFFKGGIDALSQLSDQLTVPVILKETGCGFSFETLQRIDKVNLYSIDVAGLGGTHWGRIEGGRNSAAPVKNHAAKSFENWGISTVDTLLNAARLPERPWKVWASGGIRTGLDVAKCLALGAECVGLAQPLLGAALQSEEALNETMERIEFELKVALFCTGCGNVDELQKLKVKV